MLLDVGQGFLQGIRGVSVSEPDHKKPGTIVILFLGRTIETSQTNTWVGSKTMSRGSNQNRAVLAPDPLQVGLRILDQRLWPVMTTQMASQGIAHVEGVEFDVRRHLSPFYTRRVLCA